MKRWRALLGILGVGIAGVVAYEAQPGAGTSGRTQDVRYRDGRGRVGRGGPASAVAAGCVPATGAALVNGDWSDLIVADGTSVTRTLNAGADPGCGTAMERLQLSATTTGAASIDNITICPDPVITGSDSYGCWFQGTSGSGTTDIASFDGAWHTHPIAFTTTAAWFHFNAQPVGVTGNKHLAIGNLSVVNGGTARSAVDVKVWGCRCVDAATISQ